MRRASVTLLTLLPWLASCGGGPPTEAILPGSPERATIRMESPAFEEGGAIPTAHTCDGRNSSPPLNWSSVPGSARSLALIVDDPDALGGAFSHWVLFNLPPDAAGLPGGVVAGERIHIGSSEETATQGRNDFHKNGYGGPCPPGGMHHYVFRLYAIDTRLDQLGPETIREQLLGALNGHVLAEGRLTGRYSR